jgi:hypothetical protein
LYAGHEERREDSNTKRKESFQKMIITSIDSLEKDDKLQKTKNDWNQTHLESNTIPIGMIISKIVHRTITKLKVFSSHLISYFED